MNVNEAVKKRRTIRKFLQKPIPVETLKQLVEGARLAPSGGNVQPWAFIIVDDPELIPQVFSTLAWAGYISPEGNPPEGKQPTAYIVILQNKDISSATHVADLAAAIENMILLAIEQDIGSCWIGSIRRKDLSSILLIPPNYYIDSVIALGYPDEAPVIEKYTGSIKYWKDPEGALHVPKRSLQDILSHNQFGNRCKEL